jgi:uncharacterized membrane protein YesL
MTIFLFLPIACLIASIGLAGGAYVIRNMVWTEGVFVANDFWRGIKQNAKELMITSFIYSLLLYSGLVSISFANQALAVGSGIRWLLITSKVVVIVLLVFFTIVMLHMVAMCVTYKLKYLHLIRNAFLFTIGFLPHNVFFLVLALIPFIVYLLGGFFMTIGLCLIVIFGLSYLLLVWTDGEECYKEYSENDGLWGAKRALEHIKSQDYSVRAVVCLDMLGDKNLNISLPQNTTPVMRRLVRLAAKRTGFVKYISEINDSVIDDHAPFFNAGYNVVNLIDFMYGSEEGKNDYWHTSKDIMENISVKSLEISGKLLVEIINILCLEKKK